VSPRDAGRMLATPASGITTVPEVFNVSELVTVFYLFLSVALLLITGIWKHTANREEQMAVAAGIDRRALLGRGGWRAAGAELRVAIGLSPLVSELTVARRAMACEFSITFPASCRSAVDAGCLALDEVERIETKLSVFIGDSDFSRINRTAASEPLRWTLKSSRYSRLRQGSAPRRAGRAGPRLVISRRFQAGT
jgi:hypothetical protein